MSLIRFMPPRGTATQCDAYTGTLGELFVDTDNWQVRLSDGSVAGGHILGGVNNLAGLIDVAVTTPANGDVLTWDSATSKWKNSASAGGASWSTLTGKPTTLTGFGITDSLSTSTGLTGGGTLASGLTLKLANIATMTMLGNNTGAAGSPMALTAAQVKSLLAIATTDITGLAASATTDTTNASHITSGTLPAAQLPALTGDVTTSGAAATIAASAVTLAKMANLAANSIIGNNTGSATAPTALSVSQVKTLLAIGASDVSGVAALAGASFTGAVQITTVSDNQLKINASTGPYSTLEFLTAGTLKAQVFWNNTTSQLNLVTGTTALTIDAGGTATFDVGVLNAGTYGRTAAGVGYLDGRYAGAESSTSSGVIYSIDSNTHAPGTTTLGLLYGIGYCVSNSTLIPTAVAPAGLWGMYVAAGGVASIFLEAAGGNGYFGGGVHADWFYSSTTGKYALTSADASSGSGGVVKSQSGGTASGGNPGDIIIIY